MNRQVGEPRSEHELAHTSRLVLRSALRSLALLAVVLGTTAVVMAGQPPATEALPALPTTTPPGGIHLQVLPGHGSEAPAPNGAVTDGSILIFLPRPPFDEWLSLAVTTDSTCLRLGALDDPGPGYVLVQAATATLPHPSSPAGSTPAAAGAACDATVEASFEAESGTWETAVGVHLYRPTAPAYAHDDVAASLSVSRIEARVAGVNAPGRRLLIEVTVKNLSSSPLALIGLSDASSVAAAGGEAYVIPNGRYIGTLDELRELEALTGIVVAPDSEVRFGLVFGAEEPLASSAGALTVQPGLLIELGGEVYSLSLNRVSTSWGDELP